MEGRWRGLSRLSRGRLALAVLGAGAMLAPAALSADGDGGGRIASKQIVGFVGGAGGVRGGEFLEPSDVAVYAGDGPLAADDKIYVTEAAAGNNRVQRLDAHGNFELMWGRDVVRRKAPGDTGGGFEVCRRAADCKAAPAGAADGELDRPMAIAVDGAAGRVYVADARNRRVQLFDLNGGFVRSWGGLARSEAGAVAVAPEAPHDVFVGDAGRQRVLQFTAAGRFVRGWGWGVATGADRLEVCSERERCRRGRPPGAQAKWMSSGWPLHLTFGHDGVLFSTEPAENDDTVRFRAVPPPRGPDASGAELPPLRAGTAATYGETLGLEADPVTGSLIVPRNKFGAMVVDEVVDPGNAPAVTGGDEPPPSLTVNERVGFIRSVHGVGVSPSLGGAIYLPVSHSLDPRDPDGRFGSCVPSRGPERPCHGLAVLARAGLAGSAIVGAIAGHGATPAIQASVDPGGVARYRLEVSSDGVRWRTVSRSRYATVPATVAVDAPGAGVRPETLYRARLLLERTDTSDVVISNDWVLAAS